MKDICYWEVVGDPKELRAEKFLLVVDENNMAKLKVNLSKMGIAKEVHSYSDFQKLFPPSYYKMFENEIQEL